MKTYSIRPFIIVLLFMVSGSIIAQTETIKKVDDLFDESGLEAADVIKFNLQSIFNGTLGLSYDKTISNSISVEAGVGLLVPFYIRDIAMPLTDDLGVDENTYGSSFYMQAKYFMAKQAPLGNYCAVQFRNRNYIQSGVKMHHNDLVVMFGAQHIFNDKIAIDYNVGLTFYKSNILTDYEGIELEIGLPVSLKIGYIL